MKLSQAIANPRYQLFGVRIDPESKAQFAPGIAYSVKPINTNETYTWTVKAGVTVTP